MRKTLFWSAIGIHALNRGKSKGAGGVWMWDVRKKGCQNEE